jgi:hypothetical protein
VETGRLQGGTELLGKPLSRLSRQFGACDRNRDGEDSATLGTQTIALKAGSQPEATAMMAGALSGSHQVWEPNE